MSLHDVSLTDRFDLDKRTVLLGGIQALVRVLLMQKARDEAAGLKTAGYATGYRGSPLGGVDQQMWKARKAAAGGRRQVRARPQRGPRRHRPLGHASRSNLHGEGRVQGVFGLWYGKGPGVDRCGDVFRHANMAGTAEFGGVVACLGDDHTGESSTVLHHSEFALGRCHDADPLPRRRAGGAGLRPPRLVALALHRLLGRAEMRQGHHRGHRGRRRRPAPPDDRDPDRLRDARGRSQHPPRRHARRPGGAAARLQALRRRSVRARQPDRPPGLGQRRRARSASSPAASPGSTPSTRSTSSVSTRPNAAASASPPTRSAWSGRSTWRASASGRTTSSSSSSSRRSASSSRCRSRRRSSTTAAAAASSAGRTSTARRSSRSSRRSTRSRSPAPSARCSRSTASRPRSSRRAAPSLEDAVRADNAEDIAVRKPWFCSGCPHNTSTRLPEGARAYAGIGCHYMVQWMERDTEGFTHMGGEGANWIGEAPFSTRKHMFQNLGDGTYNHSGVLAIRAALAAGVNITYKILFNDAVAMTGGQPNEGGLTAQQIARELQAMGVKTIVGVYDPKEDDRPPLVPRRHRACARATSSIVVQREMQDVAGVSAIVYIQTCAAEKRRRRKRGQFPDPDRRVFINPDVCEGCGDCGVQSNCVSILPLETEFGRKRDDRPVVLQQGLLLPRTGFCPSFVTLEGAKRPQGRPRRARAPRPPGAEAAGDRRDLQHRHHRRRRHRRRHRRRADRHGGAPRGQGRRRDGDGWPRAEGRGGAHPLPHRRDPGATSRRSASRSARPTR